ncbi:Oidioi.mRNA.OKI2018_I69.chr1.g241.t1.cds [Oikopleura dioica]|uniref:Oidioi.mRNA.OKI2018_I69.chr1.g241.t1.cds n=1 Tax=Oikopleura dioica TaxID=34765 RepID=A0ABN7SPB1_OIKDI|nr:Oidioi.mRNA.OKI2018_I69.chr1.g241.t1.cds [Oikopleura dioica]
MMVIANDCFRDCPFDSSSNRCYDNCLAVFKNVLAESNCDGMHPSHHVDPKPPRPTYAPTIRPTRTYPSPPKTTRPSKYPQDQQGWTTRPVHNNGPMHNNNHNNGWYNNKPYTTRKPYYTPPYTTRYPYYTDMDAMYGRMDSQQEMTTFRTEIHTTTSTATTTTTTTTTTSVPLILSGVQTQFPKSELSSRGFKKYFSADFSTGRVGQGLKEIPAGAQNIFVGTARLMLCYILFCENNEPLNQVGVFGDESLFFARSFPYQQQTTAIPANGFYSYYSNNEIPGEPFGFAASPDIYLGPFDFFDCQIQAGRWDCPPAQLEKSRMSLYMNFPYSSGWRCGSDTAANYESATAFKKDFVLEAWYN